MSVSSEPPVRTPRRYAARGLFVVFGQVAARRHLAKHHKRLAKRQRR